MPSCPAGVTGRESEYWALIDGPGSRRPTDAEPVKVTGGTCAGGWRPGTLQFAACKSACRRLHNSQRFQCLPEMRLGAEHPAPVQVDDDEAFLHRVARQRNCSANPVTGGQIVVGSVTLAHGEATVKGSAPRSRLRPAFNVLRATRPRRSTPPMQWPCPAAASWYGERE
jgi:hypothetical protein